MQNNFTLKQNKNYTKIALVSGSGDLPVLVLRELKKNKVNPLVFCPLGIKVNFSKNISKVIFDICDLENLIFELKKRKITHLLFAGKITRHDFNEKEFILKSTNSKFSHNIQLSESDDLLLRKVGNFFEKQDFKIIALQDIIPDSLLKSGKITTKQPSIQDKNDIYKALELHDVMSNADFGQSLIVSEGLCYAVETIPGTDYMIDCFYNFKKKNYKFNNTSKGIFFKSLKINQDNRFDFPVVGEKTLIKIKKAKLNGLALKEDKLILLKKDRLIELANELGLFIYAIRDHK